MVKFESYTVGDVSQLNIREGDDYGTEIIEYDDNYVAFTLKKDGKPICCWGIVTADKGVGFLWAYITEECRGHAAYMIRFGRRVIDRAMRMGFHRLQSNVRADKREYVKFTELLGLEKEGLMRKATANKLDLWLFARVE